MPERLVDPTGIPDWPVGPSFVTPRGQHVWIAASIAADTSSVAAILLGVDETVAFFEIEEGLVVPPHDIGVQDHEGWRFDGSAFGDAHPVFQPTLEGCWCGPRCVMIHLSTWRLYHELAHSMYGLWLHDDPRWPVWNTRTDYSQVMFMHP